MTIGNQSLSTNILDSCNNGLLYCYAKWSYNVTGGLFWTFMLLAFCVALFIVTIRMGSGRAFGFASFVGLVGSIWFATMQLMPWWTASAFILVGAIGIVVMLMQERG